MYDTHSRSSTLCLESDREHVWEGSTRDLFPSSIMAALGPHRSTCTGGVAHHRLCDLVYAYVCEEHHGAGPSSSYTYHYCIVAALGSLSIRSTTRTIIVLLYSGAAVGSLSSINMRGSWCAVVSHQPCVRLGDNFGWDI